MLIAGVVGLGTGVVAMLAFRYSERKQREYPVGPPADLDQGLVRVLAVLRYLES